MSPGCSHCVTRALKYIASKELVQSTDQTKRSCTHDRYTRPPVASLLKDKGYPNIYEGTQDAVSTWIMRCIAGHSTYTPRPSACRRLVFGIKGECSLCR